MPKIDARLFFGQCLIIITAKNNNINNENIKNAPKKIKALFSMDLAAHYWQQICTVIYTRKKNTRRKQNNLFKGGALIKYKKVTANILFAA